MTDSQTTKRERVARAIFEADGTDSNWKWEPGRWDRATAGERERYFFLADAALMEIERDGR